MRKIFLVILFFAIIQFAVSQDDYANILNLMKNGELKQAKELVDKLTTKDQGNSKIWLHRGAVYQTLYESENPEFKALHNDPLNESYYSFKKSMELDLTNEYLQINLKSLGILSNLFVKKGIDEFNAGDFKEAFRSFENNIEINERPAIMLLDTIIYYNAAISAEKIGKYDKAEYYLKKLIVFKYNSPQMYLDLAGVYKKQNDLVKYKSTLNDGIAACPGENIGLISEFINYYLSIGNIEKTLEYIEEGIKIEPENPDFYFIRGSISDQKGETEKARKDYFLTIEKEPEHIDALYNLGAIYFNEGLTTEKNAMSKADKKNAEEKYFEAIKYFEKVHNIDNSDSQTIKLLIQLYSTTSQENKKTEMEKKFLNLNN
ncbi:MAG: tetratricopeptide repeat protein [Bacteroidota bacterium]